MDDNNNRPVHEIRMGAVKASIWQNESKSGATFLTASFHTLFRDAEGAWKRSSSFGREDLLLLAKVANEAHSYMLLQTVSPPHDGE